MKIEPADSLRGAIEVPGDKSISHRYAIFGGMATGKTTIRNFSASEDCYSTLQCLRCLDIDIETDGETVFIQSEGWQALKQPKPSLDAGNSGTTIRLLSAFLASRPVTTTISGDRSLNSRPMRRIIDPLSKMGATIEARDGQFPPLTIHGAQLQPVTYKLPVASAQVKSCVLLAGLTASGRTTVIETTQSRDHTERAVAVFGGNFSQEKNRLSVEGPAELRGAEVIVPGDFSSAVYFICAALLLPRSELRIRGIGVNPTRTGFLRLLEEGGAQVEKFAKRVENGEPACDLLVSYDKSLLEKFPSEISGHWIPNLIDEIPILAVLGTQLRNGLTVRDAGELRKKESDRIHAIVTNLRNIGVAVEEYEDGFQIPQAQSIEGGRIETFGDHRIAMAFSIGGLLSESGVEIDQPECANISFPGFYSSLDEVKR